MIKYRFYDECLQQMHLLIAGAAGSGKSVIINGIIYNGLFKGPDEIQFIFIDPKRVELSEYRYLPHCIRYASEPVAMVDALQYAMVICENRYRDMQRRGLRKYDGSDIYVIIDELADLMTTNRKAVQPLIQRLCQIGRAARIHVYAATQCPLAVIIPTPILVNFDSRIALHTATKQHSRNIIEIGGAETLPKYGKCIFSTPSGKQIVTVEMYTDAERRAMLDYWTRPVKRPSLVTRLKARFK